MTLVPRTPQSNCRPKPTPKPIPTPCPQLPGTLFRIHIPAGAVINLLNLIELTSPSGICLIIRIPALGGSIGKTFSAVTAAIEQAGGQVEIIEE
ncbi:hypothetical protein CACET_c07040 [Clostridium aceticum]|uniref:Uncharacterized protein n=1 Tax=Clostridium aceticum TaxID=84022 RepID=A0A0D8IEF2_9CLOT|nr:hypothetical protein [Clostridium aceticum]AKL94214.1 hypothetical protein CACET_c07040 [Clostridium aceticum]KJF28449.1 hypothetical protein TZ02_00505 [Clostridium aceticum]